MDFLAFGNDSDGVAPTSISKTAGAPWLCRLRRTADTSTQNSSLVELHNEILALCDFVSPNKEDMRVRADLEEELKSIIQSVHPESTMHVFGSQMTGILTPSSDLDLAVLNIPGDGLEPLYAIEKALLEKGVANYLEVIGSAKVPIIKMDHIASGISVDILCNNDSGIETGRILKKHVKDFPALKPLTVLLKVFLGQRKLNETYGGGVGSFVLSTMVISFLQMRQRIAVARRLEEGETTHNLGCLLLEFLALYGTSFNYCDVGITITEGGMYFDKRNRGNDWVNPTRPLLLAIENPVAPGTDMGRNSFLIPRVKKAFEHAHRVLLYALTSSKTEFSSILSLILNAEDPNLLSIPMVPLDINPTSQNSGDSAGTGKETPSHGDNEVKSEKKKKKKKRKSVDQGDQDEKVSKSESKSAGRKIITYTEEADESSKRHDGEPSAKKRKRTK